MLRGGLRDARGSPGQNSLGKFGAARRAAPRVVKRRNRPSFESRRRTSAPSDFKDELVRLLPGQTERVHTILELCFDYRDRQRKAVATTQAVIEQDHAERRAELIPRHEKDQEV